MSVAVVVSDETGTVVVLVSNWFSGPEGTRSHAEITMKIPITEAAVARRVNRIGNLPVRAFVRLRQEGVDLTLSTPNGSRQSGGGKPVVRRLQRARSTGS